MSRLTRLPSGRRSKFLILALWLVVASAAAPLAFQLPDAVSDDEVDWLPRSAEATAAFERAEQAFPGSDRLVAVAVYAREGGLTAGDRASAAGDREAFARYAAGGRVPSPIASGDGEALLLSFPLAGTDDEQTDAAGAIRDRLERHASGGLETGLTGSAGAEKDIDDAFAGLDVLLLLVAAGVVGLILLVTYRSPFLWLVPLIVVAVASYVGMATVYLLAEGGLTVDFQAQSILTVLLFGVGTDYALLLIARYREELRRHSDRHEAMAVALRRSFPAIVASAATVTLALLTLLAADLNTTRGLGPVAAVGVVSALVVMTTMLPALLVLFGRWLFWPFVPRYGASAAEHRAWSRVAGVVGRRPRPLWLGSAVVLGVLAIGVTQLNLGVRDAEVFTEEVGSVRGQRLVEQHYPSGSSAPVDIYAAAGAAERTVSAAHSVPGVAAVRPPVISADGRWVHVEAVLAAPPDTDEAKATVDRLRDVVHAVPDAHALVGGSTAVDLDTERASERDNKLVMPLILGVVLLVLIAVLRSFVAPLLLLASVVLSFAAAMGAAVLVFHLIGYPNVWVGFPLQAFLFLVALGVDYTIFLMTRAREETAEMGHDRGVLRALAVTGGVITSAGLVLAATFSALVVLPLVPSLQIGIVVALGVLIDTFLVRSLLVPALSIDLGPRIWWPSRLARRERVSARPATVPGGS